MFRIPVLLSQATLSTAARFAPYTGMRPLRSPPLFATTQSPFNIQICVCCILFKVNLNPYCLAVAHILLGSKAFVLNGQ
jgi:hypothetical protein